MKYWVFTALLYAALVSCSSEPSKNAVNTSINKFQLNGKIVNFEAKKVYLNKLVNKSLYPIDSANITNKQFVINGIVEYPERFILTFDSNYTKILLIVENQKFNITIDSDNFNDPIIKGSKLNDELNAYKNASKLIFNKIDYLYPHFQKARLENDSQRLEEIGKDMKSIETEFNEFSYKYISKHSNSFIAPILLNDLLKSSKIDTLKIKECYTKLDETVQKSPDAVLVASFLNLH